MIFKNFDENIHYRNTHSQENSSMLSFLWFTLKKVNLGLKMKILKFLGIQPTETNDYFSYLLSFEVNLEIH